MLRTLLTRVETGKASSRPGAAGTSRARRSSAPDTAGSSHASYLSGSTSSGIRSWMRPSWSSAVVVSTVQVHRNRSGSSSARVGSRQISYRPAIASTLPSAGWMKNGCFSGRPALVFWLVVYHS